MLPTMSLKLVLLASTRMILAAGAMAWAHSTSRLSSTAQPVEPEARRITRAVRLIDLLEAGRIGQAELLVKQVEIAGGEVRTGAVNQVRVVVGIDDGDRLTGAVCALIEP